MKKVDLNKVLERLINEELDEATSLLHEWFVETTKSAHEEISEGDALSSDIQDIQDDQEAIKAEEFYSEAEGDDEAEEPVDDEVDGEEVIGNDEVEGSEEVAAEDELGDTIEDLEAVMLRLKAEYAQIVGDDEAEAVVDDTEVEVDEGSFDNMQNDQMFDDAENMARAIEDLRDELLGDDYSPEAKAVDAVLGQAIVDCENSADLDGEWLQNLSANLNAAAHGKFDTDSLVAQLKGYVGESEVVESEDFADLEESWNLEAVKDPNLNGGKEIGADGASVSVNDKSPLPNHKTTDRVGGKAVEIKAKEHKGYDREAAPEVKAKPLLKNQVKKATDGRTGVSKEGDKSAMLNKKDGFGSDSPKSPIGAGAADLRGSDFKRK